jgi:hypothetical protein
MTRKPNIIMVLADDLGWSELESYGNTFNETPYLNRLADEGMRFTHAYASAPVCSPYRACLMTGQYPARIGITDYLRPDDVHALDPKHITIAKMLRRNGYMTGLIGKWHLSGYHHHGRKEISPCEHGFEETVLSENRGIAGGVKGFSIGLLVEVLCAALAGGKLGTDQGSFTDDDGKPIDNGQFFVAFDPGKFSGGGFDQTITKLVASMTEQDGARLPNARRETNKLRLAEQGIPIDAALYETLKGFA